MKAWAELWHQFIATLTAQPVAVVLAVWVCLALVAVMALEGLLLNLFPALVFRRYLEKKPEWKTRSAEPPAPVVAAAPIIAPPIAPEPLAAVSAEPPPQHSPQSSSKRRRPRNRKKSGPGPKSAHAATGWRQAAPPRERRSQGAQRLFTPKN